MNKNRVLWFGIAVVIFGIFLLLGEYFRFNAWALFFPLLLVGLGVWLIVRPRMNTQGAEIHTRILGEIIRDGRWSVTPQELWLGVGDVILDFSEADIPEGQIDITVFSFVGDLKCRVPEMVGIRIICSAFISEVGMFGEKETSILMPLERQSDGFDDCKRRIVIHVNQFIVSAKIRRPG